MDGGQKKGRVKESVSKGGRVGVIVGRAFDGITGESFPLQDFCHAVHCDRIDPTFVPGFGSSAQTLPFNVKNTSVMAL